jgi:PLP dependent protein
LTVKENLDEIETRISEACNRVARNKGEVTIIAVTKYVSIDRTKEAVEAGVVHLGENRDEGFLEKREAIGDKPIWHFIGSLQTRKVKNVINKIDYLHSLDRLSLASEIQKRATKKVKCFIQVNVSGENAKHGLNPQELMGFLKGLEPFTLIEVVGLMTMAPLTEESEIIRKNFSDLKELQKNVQALGLSYAPCNELSMGMSNDYEIAIEEGATYIRLGTSLVGKDE